jgi:hypothetical protein
LSWNRLLDLDHEEEGGEEKDYIIIYVTINSATVFIYFNEIRSPSYYITPTNNATKMETKID